MFGMIKKSTLTFSDHNKAQIEIIGSSVIVTDVQYLAIIHKVTCFFILYSLLARQLTSPIFKLIKAFQTYQVVTPAILPSVDTDFIKVAAH